jgi:hypothetical protein
MIHSNKQIMKTRTTLLLAVVLSSLFLSACSKNHDSTAVPVSGLMAVNLAADRGPVGVTLSGNNLLGWPLYYMSYTGGYLPVYSGTRQAISFDYMMGNALAGTTQLFEPDSYYSLFIIGANGTYRNLVVKDSTDSANIQGQAFIRYINAVPDSAGLQVNITGTAKATPGGPVAFGTVSAFTPVNAGAITVQISNGSNIQVSRTIETAASKRYTLLFTGLPSATDSSRKVQIRYIENGTAGNGKQQTATPDRASGSR